MEKIEEFYNLSLNTYKNGGVVNGLFKDRFRKFSKY